jgi:hypothetical protein
MTYIRQTRGAVQHFGARARARTGHVWKRAVQPLRNPRRRSRAAFVVGSPRSGTDLLCAKLDASLDVCLLNEDNAAAFENWRLRELDVIRRLVDQSWAKVVLLKPIVETYRVRELLDHFENSTAVFIARNPHDTINSLVAFAGESLRRPVAKWVDTDFEGVASWKVPEEIRRTAARLHSSIKSAYDAAGVFWYVYNAAFLGLRLHADRRVTLTLYRDIVRDTKTEIHRLCRKVGIARSRIRVDDVFASSIGKRPPPRLSREIAYCCDETWRHIKAARATV